MAPSFFAKLTRSSNASSAESSPRQSHSRSPSVQKKATLIKITPALDLPPTTDAAPDDIPSDGCSSLNVNVIPPSPSPSISTPSVFKNDEDLPDLKQKPTALPMPPRPAPPPSPAADGQLTPMPHRSDVPLRHSRSTGNLKTGSQPAALQNSGHENTSQNRYATLASPQPSKALSKRASNSSLIVETSKEKRVASSPSQPLVESPPTSPVHPVQTITKSFTTNNAPSNSPTFLSPKPKDSDAASIRSVSSTRSRSFFGGGTFDSIKKARSKSPKRKPTGLASAIAISGLTVAMSPQSELAEKLKDPAVDKAHSRNRSLSSVSRHDKLASSLELPGNASGRRSRTPSFVQHSEDSSGSDEGTDDDESDDVDDVTADLMPVTGFAVASSKRNADFHELFPDIPEGDYLIEDYGCALQRDILIQGRLYISENHVCFHANIFGWVTDLSIPMHEIITLEKKMTAFVIPNAILITTKNNRYTFASFLSRDNTFEVIHNSWRMSGADTTGNGGGSLRTSFDSAESGRTGMEATRANGVDGIKSEGGGKADPGKAPKVTQCQCGKDGSHYNELAMEAVFPGTPEKIHNLIFASGFIKDFMREDQKLIDLQVSDWTPSVNNRGNPQLLTRNMSYIKPLTASIGPRQTKCELSDEIVHCDFDDFVSTLTTTRTPDVPSGGVFSVKTKTCIMWASNVSSRVIVSTQVEWSGRSFIKGIIEKSCIDGQKTYHIELDRAIRGYIQSHLSEFIPEGITEAEAVVTQAAVAAIPEQIVSSAPSGAMEEKGLTRNRRGLQWAYDTFEGAFDVAKKSAETAFELIGDALDSHSSVPWSHVVIFVLVITNIWTIWGGDGRKETKRKKELLKNEERERWVKEAVTTLWKELAKNGEMNLHPAYVAQPPLEPPRLEEIDVKSGSWKGEAEDMSRILDELQIRLDGLRTALGEVQAQEQPQDQPQDQPQGPLGDLD